MPRCRRCLTRLTLALPLVAIALPAFACSPVVQLIMAFGGPAGWAGMVGLPLVVAIKAVVFARREATLPPGRASWRMVQANVFTTVTGYLMAVALFSAPAAMLLPLAILYAVSLPACRRMSGYLVDSGQRRVSPYVFAAGVVGLVVLSSVLYALAEMARGDAAYGSYWLFKTGYALVAVIFSMGLTTWWEEWAIARLEGEAGYRFMPAVVRANLTAFGIVAALGAVLTIPARWHSPGFLIGF